MAKPDSGTKAHFCQLQKIEQDLAQSMEMIVRQVSHSENLDQEKRAEIYSILQALEIDGHAHREIIGRWVNDQTGESTYV